MKLHTLILTSLAATLFAYAARGDTVEQTYETPVMNILGGQTLPMTVQPFDQSLGRLDSVWIRFDRVRLYSVVRMHNPLPATIAQYSTGISAWWHVTGDTTWNSYSFTQSMVPLGCGGAQPVFLPYSAHLFEKGFDSDNMGTCNGVPLVWDPLWQNLGNPVYFLGGPVNWTWNPGMFYSAHYIDGTPWVVDPQVRVWAVALTVTVVYEYTQVS